MSILTLVQVPKKVVCVTNQLVSVRHNLMSTGNGREEQWNLLEIEMRNWKTYNCFFKSGESWGVLNWLTIRCNVDTVDLGVYLLFLGANLVHLPF